MLRNNRCNKIMLLTRNCLTEYKCPSVNNKYFKRYRALISITRTVDFLAENTKNC